MVIQTLHQDWKLQIVGTEEWIPATVPGSVYADLLCAGKLEDPFYRDNEMDALAIMEHDFVYRTCFDAEQEVLGAQKVYLHCEGLDTLAKVYLNEVFLGSTENMHRMYEFAVDDILREKDNTLEVHFASPTRYVAQQHQADPAAGSQDSMRGFTKLRKAHCMFGWDWGPRLPDAGIWRPIGLYGVEKARLDTVQVRQQHEAGRVTLQFAVQWNETQKDQPITYRVTVVSPDGESTLLAENPKQYVIENPKLWWPNGYGAQPLYQVRVELCCGETVEDVWEKKIGLRTMTVNRDQDAYGERFAHEVNGVQIFAMGADYIPEDNLFSRITEETTRKMLENCIAANFNCIRVWGGGYYPDDYFYDICDELGLLVWQDCMFACGVYHLNDAFEENVRAEIRENVRRIRHHASLGLWCGNNEMEMLIENGEYPCTLKEKADQIKLFEYIIPKLIKEEDPDTFYWSSSPSSGGSFDCPNAPDKGDVHYWDVWHGNKPFTEYRKFFFRYLSEFGFQSFPLEKTVETFTLPQDRNIFSYVMEKHQRNNAANGKIMNYLSQTYLYPTDFSTLLYATHLLQADAIKYGVEHFRRNRGRCMGAVYWQLNDCWPVASWSSIDYEGRWKALHYYAKRFFAPVLLSCEEQGVLTQDANVNAQPYALHKSVRFNVSNETMQDKEVRVVWSVRNNDGTAKWEKEETVVVPALSAVWLLEQELPDLDIRKAYIRYTLYEGEQEISSSSVILALPKHFHYLDPQLDYRIEGDEIVITSKAYAKSVEIQNEAQDMLLSDNYFDLDAGEKRVKILSGKPEGIKLRSVYDIH